MGYGTAPPSWPCRCPSDRPPAASRSSAASRGSARRSSDHRRLRVEDLVVGVAVVLLGDERLDVLQRVLRELSLGHLRRGALCGHRSRSPARTGLGWHIPPGDGLNGLLVQAGGLLHRLALVLHGVSLCVFWW